MPRVVSAAQLRGAFSANWGKIPSVAPLWTVNLNDTDAVANWIQDALEQLMPEHNAYVQDQDRKRDFYAGLQALSSGAHYTLSERTSKMATQMQSKITANRIFNIIELWVAKLTRYAPNVVVNPANSEQADRIAAKLGKLIADNIAYQNDVESLLENRVRMSRIDGETYIFVDFDKQQGDYKQTDEEAKEFGLRKPVMFEGQPIVGVDNEPLMVDTRERIGEVRYEPVDSRFVLLEPKPTFGKADWCIRLEICYADEIRAKYPGVEVQGGSENDVNIPWIKLADNEVIKATVYHRSTEFLDSGAEIVYCQGQVLEIGAYKQKASKKTLPCVRYSCIDIPGYQRGMSILDNLLVLQVMYNNILSLAYNNVSLAAHAYWLVPQAGNVDVTKIRNSSSIIKYTGPIAPRLEVFRTLGPEVMNMLTQLDELITNTSGHQGISSGDTPPGVDAAIALGVLEEQENQRANPEIKKYNAVIKKLYQLGLGCAQDNYKKDDGRLLRIVGKNNQDTIKAIDMANFAGPFDVRVARSTALSESKALRQQQLVMIKQNWPNAISDTQFLDLMELGDEQRLYDTATASIKAALAENERFYDGGLVLPPAEYEDHFEHWPTHCAYFATLSFKEDVPEEVQKLAFAHQLTHESFMFELACQSPAAMQKLLALNGYPKFFKLPMPLARVAMMVNQGIDVQQAIAEPAVPMQSPLPPQGPPAPLEVEAEPPPDIKAGQAPMDQPDEPGAQMDSGEVPI